MGEERTSEAARGDSGPTSGAARGAGEVGELLERTKAYLRGLSQDAPEVGAHDAERLLEALRRLSRTEAD